MKKEGKIDLEVLNCTVYQTPEEGDPVIDHWKNHIPTANYLDIRYLRDTTKPYPYMMPTQQHFCDVMKAMQIKKYTRIVLYDTKPGQTYFATRAYFMFRAFGHQNVSVLNGGMTKWVAEGREISKVEVNSEDYDYKVDPSLLVTYEQIRELEKSISEKQSDT